MKSFLTHLECTYCRAAYSADAPHRTCPLPDCGKALYPRYDLQGAADALRREDLARRPANMWCYFDMGGQKRVHIHALVGAAAGRGSLHERRIWDV